MKGQTLHSNAGVHGVFERRLSMPRHVCLMYIELRQQTCQVMRKQYSVRIRMAARLITTKYANRSQK